MKKEIIISFPFIRIGGQENLIITTIKELLKNKHDVKIVTLYIDEDIRNEVEDFKNIFILPPKYLQKILKIKFFRYFLGIPIYFFLLLIISGKFSKYLSFGTLSTYLISLIQKFKNEIEIYYWECDVKIPNKVLIKYKDPYQKSVQTFLHFFQDFLDNLFLKSVKGIIVIDDKNLSYAKKQYKNLIKNYFLIYPPFSISNPPINLINVREVVKKIFNRKSKYLSVIGSLDERKNTIYSLKLVNYLIQKNLEYKLLVIGSGELGGMLKSEASKFGLLDSVIFVGRVNQDELSYIYSNIYCNLFFARHQTWGLTPFEALTYNKPSIVSNESGCSEFLLRKKINHVHFLNNDFSCCVEFLEKDCKNFKFDLSNLDELSLFNYYKKLSSVLF